MNDIKATSALDSIVDTVGVHVIFIGKNVHKCFDLVIAEVGNNISI